MVKCHCFIKESTESIKTSQICLANTADSLWNTSDLLQNATDLGQNIDEIPIATQTPLTDFSNTSG